MSKSQLGLIATVALLVFAGLVWPSKNTTHDESDSTSKLVVYCSCDAVIAGSVIQRFEKFSGITVDVRYDEEASKSLGLTNLLIAERDNPRADVFWNNQTLGTIRLQREGVLAAYQSVVADRIPAVHKDADGHWTGFAGRLRVFIVRNAENPATDEAILAALTDESLERVTIAQPMFGTTLSHYSVLADQWGLERLKAWHRDIRDRGIKEVRGNSMTRDLVAEGICDIGFTDTDDAFGAIDKGKPVEILPVRLDGGSTICLPNSVAIVKDCPHRELAERFVDFLLSEDVELMLANASARQIPLGEVDESKLPEDVRQLKSWADESVSLVGAADVNQEVLDWLRSEYTGQ